MFSVCGERLVVIPDERPEQVGSLVVPESVALVPTTGKISQVGPDCRDFEVGQRVAFPERAGTLARIGEEVIRILTSDEILCIIPEEANAVA